MKSYKVITLFPELIESFAQSGVVSQAIKNQIAKIETVNPREFTSDTHKTVDDRPFGGGDGMIMLHKPLEMSLKKCGVDAEPKPRVIYMSPQGPTLTVKKAKELAKLNEIIFISGRYGGIDQRVINRFVDEELSIGDYVLSGGELAACVTIDALLRWVPGVLGHADSVSSDSLSDGLLEAPSFTRPQEYEGQKVPAMLVSGDHKKIEKFRELVSRLVTLQKRPDLFALKKIDAKKIKELRDFLNQLSDEDRKALGLQFEKLITALKI